MYFIAPQTRPAPATALTAGLDVFRDVLNCDGHNVDQALYSASTEDLQWIGGAAQLLADCVSVQLRTREQTG